MSIFGNAKEFFGLGVYNADDEAYYDDDHRYDRTDEANSEGAYGHDEHGYVTEPRRGFNETARRTYTPAIVTAAPRNYNDAKEVGEPFRDGDAVIMDLTDLDPADAKRLVDFAAGLCFALRGKMHNLSKGISTDRRVFAIVPENASMTSTELQLTARLR